MNVLNASDNIERLIKIQIKKRQIAGNNTKKIVSKRCRQIIELFLHLFLIRFTVPTRHNLTQKQTKQLTPFSAHGSPMSGIGIGYWGFLFALRFEADLYLFFFQTVYFKYICRSPLSFSVAKKGLHLISVLLFKSALGLFVVSPGSVIADLNETLSGHIKQTLG